VLLNGERCSQQPGKGSGAEERSKNGNYTGPKKRLFKRWVKVRNPKSTSLNLNLGKPVKKAGEI